MASVAPLLEIPVHPPAEPLLDASAPPLLDPLEASIDHPLELALDPIPEPLLKASGPPLLDPLVLVAPLLELLAELLIEAVPSAEASATDITTRPPPQATSAMAAKATPKTVREVIGTRVVLRTKPRVRLDLSQG